VLVPGGIEADVRLAFLLQERSVKLPDEDQCNVI
jgi:hypothetical protein